MKRLLLYLLIGAAIAAPAFSITIEQATAEIQKLEQEIKVCRAELAEANQKLANLRGMKDLEKGKSSVTTLEKLRHKHSVDAKRAKDCIDQKQNRIGALKLQIEQLKKQGPNVRTPHPQRK